MVKNFGSNIMIVLYSNDQIYVIMRTVIIIGYEASLQELNMGWDIL